MKNELDGIKAMVVRSATCRPAGHRHWTPLGCTKRPGGKKCKGHLRVSREDDAVEWHCPACGDNGWIRGWVDGPDDLTGQVEEGPLGIRQGKSVGFETPVYSQLIHTFRESMFEVDFLWTAQPEDGRALIRADPDDWEDLADALSAEESALDSGAHKKRLGQALDALELALAGDAVAKIQSEQAKKTNKLLEGLRLLPSDKEKLAKAHGALSAMLGIVSSPSDIDEQVRSIAEGYVLQRQITQCFSQLPRDPYHMPLFGTALSIVLESVETLAAKSQPQAFSLYLFALANLAKAAPSLPQDENEVTDFAQEIASEAHGCLEKGAQASTDRIKLMQLCLECWRKDNNDNFEWAPDWIAKLSLIKKERRAILDWLKAQARSPEVLELTKVWESRV